MGYQSPLAATSLPPQIEWGRTREAVAQQDYITAMKEQGHQVVVKDCGLSLLANRAYPGASSDGRVYDPASTHQSGVLEIKCPYSIDGKLIIKERVACENTWEQVFLGTEWCPVGLNKELKILLSGSR